MSNVYWDLSDPRMVQALRAVVRGQGVVELGGACGELAEVMVNDCMADYVMVVEKETIFRQQVERARLNRVHYYWGYALDFAVRSAHASRLWGVAVVSWPPNNHSFDHGAIEVFRRSAQIVILGKNDGVTSVGTSMLWNYLVTRERTQSIEGSRNDLVAYGPNPRPPGQTLAEIEHYGLQYDEPGLCLITSQQLLQAKN